MRFRAALALAAVLSYPAAAGAAESAVAVATEREIIPGSELMTTRERERYRERMRAAGTRENQAQVRESHVKQMRERARLRGLDLAPPPKPGSP